MTAVPVADVGGGRYGVQGQSNAASIRTSFSVGFDAPAGNAQKLSSTLTQQLARKLFLKPEKSIERKVKDWVAEQSRTQATG